MVEDALAFWRGEPAPPSYRGRPMLRTRTAAEFVAGVIDATLGVKDSSAGRR